MSYKKIAFIDPSLLYKDDLCKLEEILRKHVTCEGYDLSIRAVDHGHDISTTPFHSMKDLFAESNLPDHLDQLTIETKEVCNGVDLLHSTRVFLDKRIADVHLFSADNKAWVDEMREDLEKFFDQRKPWYWYVARSVPPIFNLSNGLALVMAALIIVSKVHLALIFPLLVLLSGGIFLFFGMKKITFRYIRICLFNKEEDRRPNYEIVALLGHLIALAIAIAGTLIMTWGKI